MLINWQEDYSVGIQTIDDQHKKMFGLINTLYEAMEESKDLDYKEELLKELSDYGKVHLETEEKYFEKYNYPKKEEHKKIHETYKNKIKEFTDKKSEMFLSFAIIDYLEDWWLGHILSVDKEYAKFFSEKGVK